MPPRFFINTPITQASEPTAATAATELLLPPAAARHVQVLRLQPGSALTLFDGSGFEWPAEVLRIGRNEVAVQLQPRLQVQRDLAHQVTLALAMPANDRMDGVVEKATELGVAVLQPLMSERSVLRLAAERAEKKVAHWQGVAVAACEQCGRGRLPVIAPILTLAQWLKALPPQPDEQRRWLLSPTAATPLPALALARPDALSTLVLSGPEGGLSAAEEDAARAQGFEAVRLGPRILRADTAPLAVMAWLMLQQA